MRLNYSANDAGDTLALRSAQRDGLPTLLTEMAQPRRAAAAGENGRGCRVAPLCLRAERQAVFPMTQSILVTGGAGYVGSHACKALAAAGLVPVTYDNLGRGHRDAVRWGPLV